MTDASMLPAATCSGVDIFCLQNGKFAFLKSLFAAHTTLSSVDIYSGGTFGDDIAVPRIRSVGDRFMISAKYVKASIDIDTAVKYGQILFEVKMKYDD